MIENPVSQRDPRSGDSRQGPPLYGRAREQDRIASFLTSMSRGAALLITGEPGVGKTELLDVAAAGASAAGATILRASGIQYEAGMSFSGLNQVLLPVLDELPQLPAVHRDALNVALGFGDGDPPSRLIVSNAALVLLRAVAVRQPVLVVLDDLPWLDRASADVLSFVARRLDGVPIGMIGASRSGEEDFFDHAGLPELLVEPLHEAASSDLLEARYPDLASAIRDRVLTEAQGNPLALLELPAALGPSGRSASRVLPPTLPLGKRLQDVFRSRIASLPPPTRQLLLVMALDGTGDVRVLEGLKPKAALRDLAPAEEARVAFVDEAAHRLAFHHPLLRSAVVALSRPGDRRAAHLALANVWPEQPERHAWHLAEGTIEPDESVASQLEAVAGRILARGDSVGCVRALSRASELSSDLTARHRRLAAAAYIAADVTGDLRNAERVLADLRRGETATEGSLLAAVAASAFLLQGDGDVLMAHRMLVASLETRELDASDPIVAEALFSLLFVCAYGAAEEFWKPFEEFLARAKHVPLPVQLCSRTFADPVRAGAAALPAVEAAIEALANEPDPTQIIRIGMSASYVDRLEGMREPLWRVVNDARQGGAVASGITAMVELAFDDLEIGEWDEAEGLIGEVLAICETLGYLVPTYSARYVPAVIAAARGDLDRSAAISATILGWATPRGVIGVQQLAWQAQAVAAMARGDFEAAYREAVKIARPGQLVPYLPTALRVMIDLVESAIRTGRSDEAAAHVAAMRRHNVGALSRRLQLVTLGCAAMVAPDNKAPELFDAALAVPGVERWQFDYARIRLAYGERLRRVRSMTRSREQLRAALEIFERLQARPWSERAIAELRATGETKPKAGENVVDRLTPQELEVLKLAASGLTNKQIAERLFLSHRTVGGHLHRAFPKLGVATRSALRDALEAMQPDRHPDA